MLVEQLLAGQAKLDAMKLETATVVRALCGGIQKVVDDGFPPKVIRVSDTAYWEILSTLGAPVIASGLRGPMIRFVTTQSGHEYVLFACIDGKVTHGDPNEVMDTRGALEDLVKGVFLEFPAVYTLAGPVLVAGSKF